jgi:hypothetical protein
VPVIMPRSPCAQADVTIRNKQQNAIVNKRMLILSMNWDGRLNPLAARELPLRFNSPLIACALSQTLHVDPWSIAVMP